MFSEEKNLAGFFCHVHLIGDGSEWFQSADAHEIGQNMRIKMIYITYGDDHAWKIAINVTLHRAKTCP